MYDPHPIGGAAQEQLAAAGVGAFFLMFGGERAIVGYGAGGRFPSAGTFMDWGTTS